MMPSFLLPELMVRMRVLASGKVRCGRTNVISVPSSTKSALVSTFIPLTHTSSDSFSSLRLRNQVIR